jgi:hypothetical protein
LAVLLRRVNPFMVNPGNLIAGAKPLSECVAQAPR